MREEKGKLDLLINNAYDYDQHVIDMNTADEHTKPFWEHSLFKSWDDSNNFSGLKMHYISMVLASRCENVTFSLFLLAQHFKHFIIY